MAIEVGMWRVDDGVRSIDYDRMESERRLEDLLAADLSIVDPGWMLIGRQVPTSFGKIIDLLAVDAGGNLIVLELKRDRTPREVVAQLLDYGSWVGELEEDKIVHLFERHAPDRSERTFDEAFRGHFGTTTVPELNQAHELVLVASELDDSSERIIGYLNDEYGVSINAVFFRFFRDGEREYLTRAWLVDPNVVDEKVESQHERVPWNGEYYVSFGVGENRDWEEARKYGFISAGGGEWYTRTLRILEPGARIWVNVPGHGYVGVGTVTDSVRPIDEFRIEDESGVPVPVTKLGLVTGKRKADRQDHEKAEHFVKVDWIRTLPLDEAISEKGLFGNQNSAAKPKTEKWQHTVERLAKRLGLP